MTIYLFLNGLFIICLAFAYLDIKNLMFGNPNFNEKVIMLLIISLVFLYSSRHFLIYGRSFKSLSLEHEDFRFASFREGFGDRKFLYWLCSYLFLHLFQLMLEACLFYYAFQVIVIFDTFEKEQNNQHREMFYISYIGYFISMIGFIIESVSDEQLYYFRIDRERINLMTSKNEESKNNKIIKRGLWNRIRHPNYLGEIIYFFGLLVINYGVSKEVSFIKVLPLLLYTSMFVFYSIPAMEERLLTKYRDEYFEYQRTTYKLMPYIY